MVPSLTTTLATPIVIVAGASKPYLPIISPPVSRKRGRGERARTRRATNLAVLSVGGESDAGDRDSPGARALCGAPAPFGARGRPARGGSASGSARPAPVAAAGLGRGGEALHPAASPGPGRGVPGAGRER